MTLCARIVSGQLLNMSAISKGSITAHWRWHPQRFRTIKISPKDTACVWRHSRPVTAVYRLQRKGHVMSDMTLKADQERQGWTQSSDTAWAAGYVIVTILLVLLWANVPA